MTPKQILDSFSETLIRDERILSSQERSLIGNLLQHARVASGANRETQEAVRAVMASAIGETVAQRAFAVLGSGIVERILESSSLPQADAGATRQGEIFAGPAPSPSQPQSPGVPAPKAPMPVRQPEHPGHRPLKDSPKQPQSPGTPLTTPKQPQSPGAAVTKTVVTGSVATAERPDRLQARCLVLDEFLSPQELEELTRFALEHEQDFQASEVVSPAAENGVIDHSYRRSKVLMDLAQYQDMILNRVKSALPEILEKLGMEPFTIAGVEAQITASNDGDFFQFHNDNGSEGVASRHLTFVYFFHREPRQFTGGELRIHDASLRDGEYVSEGSYQAIVPQQNQIVFFPCELLHEITPIECTSQAFADSRFTLNGWLRQ